jgi:hypothetical protein
MNLVVLYLLWWTGALGALFGFLGEILGLFVGLLPTMLLWTFGLGVVIAVWSGLGALHQKTGPMRPRTATMLFWGSYAGMATWWWLIEKDWGPYVMGMVVWAGIWVTIRAMVRRAAR